MSISGTWTGEFVGTDHGTLTLELKTVGGKITGIGQTYSPKSNRRLSFAVAGEIKDGEPAQFTFTRTPGSNSTIEKIHMRCSVEPDDTLIGHWKAENGQEGTFVAKRLNLFASEKPATLRPITPRTKPALPPARPDKSTKTPRAFVPASPSLSIRQSKPILILHGPNSAIRRKVVQYIEAIGAAPLILREEITTGIASETLEDVAERIGFAVVLLTPDDVAHPASKPEDNRQRPSQNVVLELGYLAAKLGRSKILVFTNGDIELPNYVLGLNCEAIDRNEGWKLCLARELKNAGFQVDLNGAL